MEVHRRIVLRLGVRGFRDLSAMSQTTDIQTDEQTVSKILHELEFKGLRGQGVQ